MVVVVEAKALEAMLAEVGDVVQVMVGVKFRSGEEDRGCAGVGDDGGSGLIGGVDSKDGGRH